MHVDALRFFLVITSLAWARLLPVVRLCQAEPRELLQRHACSSLWMFSGKVFLALSPLLPSLMVQLSLYKWAHDSCSCFALFSFTWLVLLAGFWQP